MYTVLFILWPWYGNLFSGPGKVLVLVLVLVLTKKVLFTSLLYAQCASQSGNFYSIYIYPNIYLIHRQHQHCIWLHRGRRAIHKTKTQHAVLVGAAEPLAYQFQNWHPTISFGYQFSSQNGALDGFKMHQNRFLLGAYNDPPDPVYRSRTGRGHPIRIPLPSRRLQRLGPGVSLVNCFRRRWSVTDHWCTD